MPAKDSQSKTSKTARVMNLLSKKPDSAPAGDAAGSSAPVPPIISSLAPDAEVSVQIKNALEDELSGQLGVQSAPAPVQPPQEEAPQPEAQSAPAEPVPVEPAAAPVSQSEPVQNPPQEEAAPRFAEPEDPGYINVMQVLVEEKAPKYTRMAGVCQCKRCLEDVKALTLNHLPPKYVVLAEGERVPRLTVYESRYSSDIISNLLQACELVSQRPHHGR